jgi:adenosylcobinamide-GDP ribazoletransferase
LLKPLKNLLSFLTVLPIRMDENMLSDCARYMWLFPLIGALIGLIAGVFGWILLSFFLPGIIVGALTLSALLLLTGLHHTDGLLDFGDGVMAHGTPEHRIEVMHDQLTGAGGLTLGMMTLLITALAFSQLNANIIIQGVIVVEVSAKLAMVVGAWAGRSVHQGMASTFLETMHGELGNARLATALLISLLIAVLLLWLNGVIVILVACIAALVMVEISHRNFKGVTGDVLGATNELCRMVAVLALVALI